MLPQFWNRCKLPIKHDCPWISTLLTYQLTYFTVTKRFHVYPNGDIIIHSNIKVQIINIHNYFGEKRATELKIIYF